MNQVREALESLSKVLEREIAEGRIRWMPDHACAECVPGGEIVIAGFQCGRHAALSALAAAPEVERVRWQCSGCKFAFPGPWQRVCPSCGRSHYWSGSVDPNATRWVGAATQPPAAPDDDPAAPSGEDEWIPCDAIVGDWRCARIVGHDGDHRPADGAPYPTDSAPTPEAAGPILADAQTRALAGWRKPTDAAPHDPNSCRDSECEQCFKQWADAAPTPEEAQAPTRIDAAKVRILSRNLADKDAELAKAREERDGWEVQAHGAGVRADNAERRENDLRKRLEEAEAERDILRVNRDCAIERATAAEQRIGEAVARLSPPGQLGVALHDVRRILEGSGEVK